MHRFDLQAYFTRISYSGATAPALETLKHLHLLHTQAIAFENLNPLLGWPVLLDIDSLQEKLIRNQRGGYCYEQNHLFKHVLGAIGFDVRGLAARVVWSVPEGTVLPRTHMLLRINLGDEVYIADVGFGGQSLTGPLRLQADVEQATPHEPFRLLHDGEEFIMQSKVRQDWKSLYRFTLQEQVLADYEMANWYVSHHPKSRFVNGLIAARPAHDRRYALLNNEFTVHYLNGNTERRVLKSVQELRDVLQDAMGLSVPRAAELDAALERLTMPD